MGDVAGEVGREVNGSGEECYDVFLGGGVAEGVRGSVSNLTA